jgi:hypothetical protein
VRFVERHDHVGGKRPVREVDGVDPFLLSQWSKRRIAIEARTRRLSWQFEDVHGRSPTSIEAQALAQRANLETREAKHGPRSEAEQRAAWRREAERDLPASPEAMVASVLGCRATVAGVDVGAVGRRVVAALEASRATWQIWHVRAEAERQARAVQVPLAQLDATVDAVESTVLSDGSVRIDPPDDIVPPAPLRRPDGTSVYDVHGATRYSSRRILDAEQVVLAAAGRTDGRRLGAVRVGLAVTEAAANRHLDASQAALVTALATSGARVQVAVAPAGTGKTAAMRVLGDLWRNSGGTLLGLAPSAAAARELGRAISAEAETLAKLVTDIACGLTTPLTTAVGPNTLLLVDEAGMAATTDLAAVVTFALRPSGPRVDGVARDHQRDLDRRIAESRGTAPDTDWTGHVPPAVRKDPSYAQLTDRLTGVSRRRADVPELIRKALADPRPLPAENPAAALWWRVVTADASTPRITERPSSVSPDRSKNPVTVTHPIGRNRGPGIGR